MFTEKTPLLVADPGSIVEETGYGNDLMQSHYTTDGRILKYSGSRVSSLAAFARISGTVFASRVPWFWSLCYTTLWVLTFVVFRFLMGPFNRSRTSGFGDLTVDVAVFMGIVMSLHTTFALRRWLTMRQEVLGALWAAIDDIAFLVAVHLPSAPDRPFKTLVLRYGLASVELLLAPVREQAEVLESLGRRGLLLPEERRQLLDFPERAKVPWVWTAAAFRKLAARGRLPSSALMRFYELCSRGRAACDQGAGYGHAQLPMVYTHLLVILAHLACALVAVRGAAVAAAASWELSPVKGPPHASKTGVFCTVACELMMAATVPICYSALLRYSAILADPLSKESIEAMPFSAYRIFMRDECEAFYTAGESAPKAVSLAVEEIEEDPEAVPMADLAVVLGLAASTSLPV